MARATLLVCAMRRRRRIVTAPFRTFQRHREGLSLMRKLLSSVAISGTLFLSPALVVAADAPTNPNILNAIQELQATAVAQNAALAAIQTALASIQTAISSVPPVSNVRFTPPLVIGDNQGIACAVANASNAAKHVKAELLRGTGAVQATFLSGNFALDPGQSSGGSTAPPRDSYVCKFTVLDGDRDDIRGTLEHFPASGVIGTSLAAE
jgi:hypothetical protein